MPPDNDSSDNLIAQWVGATFRPRTFFTESTEKRNARRPVFFAIIVSLITAVLGTVIATALADSDVNAGSLVGVVLGSVLATAISVYFSAALVHALLRIVGAGKVTTSSKTENAASDNAASSSDNQYAPPNTTVLTKKAGPGPFSETLYVVGYSQAPLLFGVLGAPGQIVGTLWSLGVLVIGLSCIHRTSLWRSFGVTFTTLVAPVFLALSLRVGAIEAFKIPSGAMMPTVMIGDHLFISKLAYGPLLPKSDTRLFSRLPPARGEVMVFKFPENKAQDFIKRAIATPGDTLEAINGRPIINGWLVPHCYVGKFGRDDSRLYVEFLEDKSYLTLYAPDAMQIDGPDEPTCKTQDDCGLGQTCRANICGHHQGPFKVRPNEVWVMGDNRNNSHDSRSWRGGQGAGVPFENIKGRAMFVWMSFLPTGGIATDRLFVQIMGTPTIPGAPDDALRSALDKCLRERPEVTRTTPPLPTSGSTIR